MPPLPCFVDARVSPSAAAAERVAAERVAAERVAAR